MTTNPSCAARWKNRATLTSEMSVIANQMVWDRFVANCPTGHLLQTWAWGELKARYGWQAMRLALSQGDQIVGGAQVLLRALPGGRHVAYVPKGPLVDWQDAAQVRTLLDELHELCRTRRCVLLKIEPPLEDMASTRDAIARHGFRPDAPTVQPPRTILVDVSSAEETILAAMKQKTRYNIRLAARKEVVVRVGGADDLPAFYDLMQTTGRRDGFGTHSPDYYRLAFDLFSPEHAALLMAHVAGKPVAGLMVFAHGSTAYYLFGASSDAHRERMPSYLLQWEAMRWARSRGCHVYDLWGIPDTDEELLEARVAAADTRAEGLWGVYRFKRGFGGRVSRSIGAFDYVYSRPLYQAYRLWTRVRRTTGIG